MRLIKVIVPVAMLATLALFAPHAGAQTMGEYATTVGVATGAGASGISVAPDDIGGGGSRTWGASSLGGSFEDRAGAASSSAGAVNFDSRAGSMTGGSESGSRWPTARNESSDRFTDTSRFTDTDRFGQSQFQDQDRFPSSAFNDNRMGLDTHYSSSGLDGGYSSSGELDNSHSSN
jgi:hypothetical protein